MCIFCYIKQWPEHSLQTFSGNSMGVSETLNYAVSACLAYLLPISTATSKGVVAMPFYGVVLVGVLKFPL